MDKQTLIISQGMQDLITQNKETNAQLKKLNKPSSLGESTTENLGEILAGLAASRMEIKAEAKLVDNARREFGTTEKGIDYTDAGTPSGVPKGNQTLYGITKAFYGKFNFGNLVNSTESVSKSVIDLRSQEKKNQDKENKVSQKAKDAFGKSEKKSTNFMTTIKRFIKDRNVFKKKKINQMNFMGGLKKGSGFTKASRGFSKKAEGGFGAKKLIKLAGKFFAPLRIGMAVGKVLTLPFRLLGKGIGMLSSAIMVPLKFIGKGIMAIPKKIFGFLGGAFSILSKIAMLGVGILALSKLSQFLRNTTPEDRKKFVDGMVKNTIKLKNAIGELGDFITLKFIPFMTDVMYGFLDNGIVKFMFGKHYSPELKALLVKRRSDKKLEEGTDVTLDQIKLKGIIDKTTDPRMKAFREKQFSMTQGDIDAAEFIKIQEAKILLETPFDKDPDYSGIIVYPRDSAIAKALAQDLRKLYQKDNNLITQVNSPAPTGMFGTSFNTIDSSTKFTTDSRGIKTPVDVNNTSLQ